MAAFLLHFSHFSCFAKNVVLGLLKVRSLHRFYQHQVNQDFVSEPTLVGYEVGG